MSPGSMFAGLVSMYSWRYPQMVARLFLANDSQYWRYIKRYWQTTSFSPGDAVPFGPRELFLVRALRVGIFVQLLAAAIILGLDFAHAIPGGWQFGLALLVSYPLVWAHLLPLAVVAWWLAQPKVLGRAVLCTLLEAQVRRLRARHTFTVVGVAGSIGKTSTKIAIARLLAATQRVQWQDGNYNDRVTVPLIFFGHREPNIFNIPAWIRLLVRNEQIIRGNYPYDVVVAELGTDGPGQMAHFAYMRPELVVLTAITPEHMATLGDLDGVAAEELAIFSYAGMVLVNTDDTPARYLAGHDFLPYSLEPNSMYNAAHRKPAGLQGQHVTLQLGTDTLAATIPLLGRQGAKIALAAAATAHVLERPLAAIQTGVAAIQAVAGRMQLLPGTKGSTLIDDTYNASPVAVIAALDVLYQTPAPQRIAILGSMNELGSYAPAAHREVGEACDASKLDWVVTVGPMAQEHIAPAAKARGCRVQVCASPVEAGAFVQAHLAKKAVVLVKGSQNGVFTEEALKLLLADPADARKLVRQSGYWMAIKRQQFPDIAPPEPSTP